MYMAVGTPRRADTAHAHPRPAVPAAKGEQTATYTHAHTHTSRRHEPGARLARARLMHISQRATLSERPRRASAHYNWVWLMMGTLRPETNEASEFAGTSLRGCTLLGTKLQHSIR